MSLNILTSNDGYKLHYIYFLHITLKVDKKEMFAL